MITAEQASNPDSGVCTDELQGWGRGKTAGPSNDPLNPLQHRSFTVASFGRNHDVAGPGSRVSLSQAHFDPRSQYNQKHADLNNPVFRGRVEALMKASRLPTCEQRGSEYSDKGFRSGNDVIAARAPAGMLSRLGADLHMGPATDTGYAYWVPEGLPEPVPQAPTARPERRKKKPAKLRGTPPPGTSPAGGGGAAPARAAPPGCHTSQSAVCDRGSRSGADDNATPDTSIQRSCCCRETVSPHDAGVGAVPCSNRGGSRGVQGPGDRCVCKKAA